MPPKKRHTRARRDKRRASSFRLIVANPNSCPQCGASRQDHRVCPSCGFYNGALIMPKKVKKKAGAAEGEGKTEGGEQS